MGLTLSILGIFAVFVAGHAFANAAYLHCITLLVTGVLSILLSTYLPEPPHE